MSAGQIEVRLARTGAEVDAAQRLRYQVFYEEWGARADLRMRQDQRDIDGYDALVDHLIVIDHNRSAAEGQVVGNYRLLRRDRLGIDGRFYSSSEFEIGMLLDSGQTLLELGRSCVLREYRNLQILQLLWRAIAGYVADHGIEVMFGCASMRGTDPTHLREQLAYLHHYHRAPLPMCPYALGPTRIDMDVMDMALIDPMRARMMLEPLIKGYLRLGAHVGDGAFVDHQFNAVDVCIVMPTAQLTQKYRRHYERVIQRQLQGQATDCFADEAAEPRLVATA
jgi:putative hemolysin